MLNYCVDSYMHGFFVWLFFLKNSTLEKQTSYANVGRTRAGTKEKDK